MLEDGKYEAQANRLGFTLTTGHPGTNLPYPNWIFNKRREVNGTFPKTGWRYTVTLKGGIITGYAIKHDYNPWHIIQRFSRLIEWLLFGGPGAW